MTLNDGFERTVSDWLDEQAGHGAPGYLDEVLARTTRTRQRPAWSSLERWLPVQSTASLRPVPRMAWLLVVLGLVVALGAAILVRRLAEHDCPSPFGPAPQRRTSSTAAPTATSTRSTPRRTSRDPLITGPAADSDPLTLAGWDLGSRSSVATPASSSTSIVVANADGSGRP